MKVVITDAASADLLQMLFFLPSLCALKQMSMPNTVPVTFTSRRGQNIWVCKIVN
jgi:hypothetical protein